LGQRERSRPAADVFDTPTKVEEDVQDIAEREEVSPYTYDITSYGADFLVDGLVQRLKSGDIVIPTFDPDEPTDARIEGFQRGFVWTKPQIDRFIESLLLGLPVPGIFLVKVEPTNVLLVLDGQQRLRSLYAFYEGLIFGREFRLENVQEPFRGKTYSELNEEDRRRLDNTIIHATIVRQDRPSDDFSSIYLVFERLNTGGTILQPQEIRVALYGGRFVRLLRDLNENPAWRRLVGPKSKRMKDQELILRFFAMFYDGSSYTRPLKTFLNDFLASNRDLERYDAKTLMNLFEPTTAAIVEGVGDRAFRPRAPVNAAVVDSIMVGVATRIQGGAPILDHEAMASAYRQLLQNESYVSAVEQSTAAEESVSARLSMGKEAFANVS
jgi:hypothetical protein